MTKLFAIQDGGDFYLFTDPEHFDPLGVVTYGRVYDFDLNRAELLRRELSADLSARSIHVIFT